MRKMVIIGLTGGIGMGKSTAAGILKGFGLPVYDADRAVHDLLKKNGKAVKPIAKLFPDAVKKGRVDRLVLGKHVFGFPGRLKKLENILHPLVREAEKKFLQKARLKKASAVVLEIPLLFETEGEARCDVTIAVTAPLALQKARVLGRPGMTEARFRSIRKHQMPDGQKKKLADYVVQTGRGLMDTTLQLEAILIENKLI